MKTILERRKQLPDYKVERFNTPTGHIYNILDTEIFLPGATSVIGMLSLPEYFRNWMIDTFPNHNWYKAYMGFAGEQGTNVHLIIERLLNGEKFYPELEEYTDKELYQAKLIMDWINLNMEEIWGSELMLAHPNISYAGSIDMVGKTFSGKNCIIDFKTGAEDEEKHRLQAAMYARLFNANYPDKQVDMAIILYSGKGRKSIKAVEYKLNTVELDEEIEVFCNMAKTKFKHWYNKPEGWGEKRPPLFGWNEWSLNNWNKE